MAIICGIDGGGTKTLCVLSDDAGRILSSASAGPSNFVLVGEKRARRSVSCAIRGACKHAGVDEIASLCLGLAGCGRTSGEETARRILEQSLSMAGGPDCGLAQVTTDARIALEAALGAKPGVVLICGTGSMALGQDGKGRFERAGGWGRFLGDQGGAFDLARRALAEVMKVYDGRRPGSALVRLVEDALGVSGPDALVEKSLDGAFAEEMPRLAPLVFVAARSGDEAAIEIIQAAGRELAGMVEAVAGRLGLGMVDLACVGGIFKDADLIVPALKHELSRRHVLFSVSEGVLPPVGGALIMARGMLGPVDEAFRAAVRQGLAKAGI